MCVYISLLYQLAPTEINVSTLHPSLKNQIANFFISSYQTFTPRATVVMSNHGHFLIVSFPQQGHINPSLQFAKKLTKMGVKVTFTTTLFAHRRMLKATGATKGLNMASFSDGLDEEGFKVTDDFTHIMSQLRKGGSQRVKEIIDSSAEEGHPVNCVVYTLLLPWAAEVAREYHIPSAMLCIQPATVLDIYYYYFNGYGEAIDNINDPIELPGLPLTLHARDLPSFLHPSAKNDESNSFAIPCFKEQFETLNADANPIVLVNSFDALETDALKAINKYKLIAIGPLMPSAFSDGKDSSDNSFGGDLYQRSKNYKDWLDSQPRESVVYISFGSMLVLSKPQMEEIGKGLLKSGMPFLWVVKEKQGELENEEKLSCMKELEKQGMIVPWCSQVEVLSHPSLGCFMTHCGWNSTLESLVSSVPLVAFPRWTDQTTNAKLIEDMWKTGVRVNADEVGGVDGDEIFRCLKIVMEERELRNNAKKWRDLAKEAIHEGGSSDKNLKTFVEEVVRGGCFRS